MKRLISVNKHIEGWDSVKVEPIRFFRREDLPKVRAATLLFKKPEGVEKTK